MVQKDQKGAKLEKTDKKNLIIRQNIIAFGIIAKKAVTDIREPS